MPKANDQSMRGFLEAFVAFLLWGILPIYWHLLRGVSSVEILLHRFIWSAVALAIYFAYRGQLLGSIAPVLSNWRLLGLLSLNTCLIFTNWLTYIWAVNSGHVLETSLGYFISPLFSILLGALVLKERLSWRQWFAVALVAATVTSNVVRNGYFPWIALLLASTFACYGLIKKIAKAGSLESLWFETAIAAIPSVFILASQVKAGEAAFLKANLSTHALLVCAGVVTAAPLVFFGWATQRLRLSTIGFMQFISPTMQFVLGIYYFREELNPGKLTTFALVWCAVGLYLWGSQKEKAHL